MVLVDFRTSCAEMKQVRLGCKSKEKPRTTRDPGKNDPVYSLPKEEWRRWVGRRLWRGRKVKGGSVRGKRVRVEVEE